MNKWNYRIIYNPIEKSYAIHEVYYDDHGKPHMWSENPTSLYGESLQDLSKDFALMQEAFSKPFLEVIEQGDNCILQELILNN